MPTEKQGIPTGGKGDGGGRRPNLVLILWGFGAFAVVVSMYRGWLSPLVDRDFVSVWVAGKMTTGGHPAQVFDVDVLRATAKQLTGNTLKIGYPYPPHALFIAVPLSLLPYAVAFWTWQIASAVLFYFASRLFVPKGLPAVLAVITPAGLVSIIYGQVGLFFGALWLFAFRGCWFATAGLTFKPHLGVLAGAEAIRAHQFIKTAAATLVMLALSLAAFGFATWQTWLSDAAAAITGDLSHAPYGIWYSQMTTPYLGYGLIGWALFAAAAIFLLTRKFDAFTAATASFLIAPYGFHYDMSVVCLGFGILLFARWRQMAAWETFVCSLVFLVPLLVQLGTWVAPPLLLAGLYIQTRDPVNDFSAGAMQSGS